LKISGYYSRLVIASGLIFSFLFFDQIKVKAEQTLYGDTGFINTPSADIISEKKINFGLAYLPAESAYILKVPNLVYSMSLGFIPRTEIGIVFTQFFHGKQDKDNPYLNNSAFDRSIFAKFLLLDESDYLPAITIGGRDVLSNSLINFEKRYNSNTSYHQFFYLVFGKTFFDYKLNLGYAYAPGIPLGFSGQENFKENLSFRTNGIFASLQTPKYFSTVSGMIEYDSGRINYGLNIDPWNNLSLKIAMINLVNPNFRLAWRSNL